MASSSAASGIFLLVVLFAVAVLADNPYRYADLHAARVQRFDELYGKRAPQVLPPGETDGLVGWRPDSPYIMTPADQGACGSCYGFAARHTVVDLMATSTSTSPKNISVQYALACSPTHETMGYCYGGDTAATANFILSFVRGKGYPSDSCSPYKPYTKLNEPACSTTCSSNSRDTFFELTQSSLKVPVLLNQNMESMIEALKTGPLLAAMQATDDFQAWGQSDSSKTQVFTPQEECQQPNHAVEIIGYVNSTDTPYWIVKNSYGTTWGDNGYAYVAAGNDPLCLESQIEMSDGSWYKAVKDFPNFLAPFDYISPKDSHVVAAVNFFTADINNSTCTPRVVDSQVQVVQGYNFRLQVTMSCPSEEPKEYLVALSWDLSTKMFTRVGLEAMDEVTPYVPDSDAPESTTSGASSTMRSTLVALLQDLLL